MNHYKISPHLQCSFREYVLYDLDRQQIVDFCLKAWADNFVVLRTALYDENEGEKDDKENYPLSIEMGNPMPHRSRGGQKPLQSLNYCNAHLLSFFGYYTLRSLNPHFQQLNETPSFERAIKLASRKPTLRAFLAFPISVSFKLSTEGANSGAGFLRSLF
jgi:hypothetical protein